MYSQLACTVAPFVYFWYPFLIHSYLYYSMYSQLACTVAPFVYFWYPFSDSLLPLPFYAFTTCTVAPFVYFWYPFLVRMIPGRGMHRVLGRVCLDQVCFMSSLLASLRSWHTLHITFLSWYTRRISLLS